MSLIAEPQHQPRLPGQQSEVMPTSPTAILALFTEIVRERFREQNGLPWVWSEGDTPSADETGDPDAPRKLLVEPSFSVHAEARNYRPAIYVDKGETVPQQAAIGNLAGKHLPKGIKGFYALAPITIDIECVSDKKGESATLADTVWFYMLAGREMIAETFGLHEMSMPVLGRTVPSERDKTEFSTHVMFTIQVHLRWATQPIKPLLNGIVLKFRSADEPNPDVYLLKQYIP